VLVSSLSSTWLECSFTHRNIFLCSEAYFS
jgi:hypothetical protein